MTEGLQDERTKQAVKLKQASKQARKQVAKLQSCKVAKFKVPW